MPRRRNYKRKYSARRVGRIKLKSQTFKLKKILPGLVFAALGILSVFGLYHWAADFFVSSPFFYVSRIELTMRPFLKEALNLDFYNIPRRCNIFQLDIDNICVNTQRMHPEFKSVVISRKPPNVISVKIEYKEPVAFIKVSLRGNYAFVPIAQDGVILPPELASVKALPVLSGLDFQSSIIKVGSVFLDKKLFFGIKFLKLVKSYWSIKDHMVDMVDLKDTKDVSIFLENGIEVKLGEGNLKSKITLLKNILEKSRFDLSKIECLDLRFTDIIVRPKQTSPLKAG